MFVNILINMFECFTWCQKSLINFCLLSHFVCFGCYTHPLLRFPFQSIYVASIYNHPCLLNKQSRTSVFFLPSLSFISLPPFIRCFCIFVFMSVFKSAFESKFSYFSIPVNLSMDNLFSFHFISSFYFPGLSLSLSLMLKICLVILNF